MYYNQYTSVNELWTDRSLVLRRKQPGTCKLIIFIYTFHFVCRRLCWSTQQIFCQVFMVRDHLINEIFHVNIKKCLPTLGR